MASDNRVTVVNSSAWGFFFFLAYIGAAVHFISVSDRLARLSDLWHARGARGVTTRSLADLPKGASLPRRVL